MLKVEHLGKFKDLSFYLPKGYICGLIGENGAGKTTLMRVLAGLYHSPGTILINGRNLRDEEDVVKDSLGLIMQDDFFEGKMTLEQIGIFYGELYKAFDMTMYLEYLNRFQLDCKQKYKNLSKGMKIKLQFAFALSHDAKLFLFDEPTAGLDKHFREEFLELCTQIVSDGERSILIASNITEDLDRIADYIAYMQAGKMLFFLPKEDLCDSFFIVSGEDYKCNLIAEEAVVYKEKGTYSTSAMVVGKKRFLLDESLEKRRPNIREFMHYFVKGGKQNAEIIAQKYLHN